MADALGKKLCQLLHPENAGDIRRAALVVVSEIGVLDPKLGEILCQILDDADATIRMPAYSTVGKLRVDRALPQLLKRIEQGGEEAEAAARAAAHLGPKGIKALQQLMGAVAPGLRRRIAGALSAGDTSSAEAAAVDILLDSDPSVVDSGCRSLLAKIPSLEPGHRKKLAEHASRILSNKEPVQPQTEAALLRLLGALAFPFSEKVFWDRLQPGHSTEIQIAALQALGSLRPPTQKDKIQLLLRAAGDADFRVAAPALMILKEIPVHDRMLDDWLELFQAPDPSVRHFALEKLGKKENDKVASSLLGQIDHPDRSLRDKALNCLVKLEQGRTLLAQQMLEVPSQDQAWSLARVQAPWVKDYSSELRSRLFKKACQYMEEGDRRADSFLFLLREAEGKGLANRLEDRGRSLRKKKQYETALIYFRFLARDPACGEAIRLELASCGLKAAAKDLAAEERASDPCLHQFAGLIQRHTIDPFDFVKKATWLDAEDLFYLGFHFVESKSPEKEFGGQILHELIRRFPKSKLVKDAKNKLRRQGIK